MSSKKLKRNEVVQEQASSGILDEVERIEIYPIQFTKTKCYEPNTKIA